jgi:hypothetical protein
MPPKVASISLPTYDVIDPPDAESVGAALDEVICQTFGAAVPREIGIRSVSLFDHPGHTHDSLADVVLASGTDRHDPDHTSVLSETYGPLGVELHIVPCSVSATSLQSEMCDGSTFYGTTQSVMAEAVSDFYAGPPIDRDGVPLRIDLLTVYDLDELEGIAIPFHDGEKPPFSSCRFRHPDRRHEAVLGLIKVLG